VKGTRRHWGSSTRFWYSTETPNTPLHPTGAGHHGRRRVSAIVRRTRQRLGAYEEGPVQIAPGIDEGDWKELDLDTPGAWPRAIEIFERRVRGRFTDAVDLLIADDEPRSPKERRWGFAVLAIDCLLVETLEAFSQGLTDTRNRSRELCVKFLTERNAFGCFFTRPLATRFYYEFRCGVAHNAQVFGTGRVWSVGPLLALDGNRMTVNRTAFHGALLAELNAYLDALRTGTDLTLRQNLRTKMDFIADGKFQ